MIICNYHNSLWLLLKFFVPLLKNVFVFRYTYIHVCISVCHKFKYFFLSFICELIPEVMSGTSHVYVSHRWLQNNCSASSLRWGRWNMSEWQGTKPSPPEMHLLNSQTNVPSPPLSLTMESCSRVYLLGIHESVSN